MAMQVGSGSRGDELNSEINVTPFVDVMLVLLVIFMITAPMLNTGVDLTLPQIEAENISDPEGKAVLSIGRHKRLYLGEDQVRWSELGEKLQTNRLIRADKELYINADQDLPYGVVVTAMGIAKKSGVDRVLLLTDPSQPPDPAELDRLVGETPADSSPGGDTR
ncbi:ExbD/TolR family protein [Haliangium sp.]|uniref:ExbD/TolR family protein n=1 Tax=Haliangium sp. TaxID=2663208 RepID=UPI003D14FEF3